MSRLCFMPKCCKIWSRFRSFHIAACNAFLKAEFFLIYMQVLCAAPSSNLYFRSMASGKINKYMHCNLSITILTSKRYVQAVDCKASFCLIVSESWLLFEASLALFFCNTEACLKPALVLQVRVRLILLVWDNTKHIYNLQYNMVKIILKFVNVSYSRFSLQACYHIWEI